MSNFVYVGNLSRRVNEEQLYELFSRVGEVVNCRIVKDSKTNCSKGYGIVEFKSSTQTNEVVLEFNGHNFFERPLVVVEIDKTEVEKIINPISTAKIT